MHAWAREGVVVFNLLMICIDAVVLWRLYRLRTAAAWWTTGAYAAAVSMLLVSLFTFGPMFFCRMSLVGYRAFPVVRMVAYVLFLHGAICMIGTAVLLRKTARKTALLSVFGAFGLLAVAADAFLIEPYWLDVSHLKIESEKVDRPVRVAVLADLQTDNAGTYERRVLERLMAERPDLILLAGDYLQTDSKAVPELSKQMNAMMGDVGMEAPLGVFAVQGNAEILYYWVSLFKGLPVVPVRGTSRYSVGPVSLTCLSMRDSFNSRLRVANDRPDRFHIVLGHSPDFARGDVDADLLLAGHTHGGQVRIPLLGPLTTGCTVPKAWAAGVTELPDGGKLVVSRGVGMERGHAPRLRFLCRPELVIIDIVPKLNR